MTLTYTWEAPDVRQFADDWARSLPVILQELERAMTESLAIVESNVVGRTPVNTGFLRQSIGHRMRGTPGAIEGEVVSIASYAAPVEYGRKPGKWPPRDAIEYWVRRKLKITNDAEVRSVAFLIARKIGTKGTKQKKYWGKSSVPAYMFTEGLKVSEKQIDAAIDRALARIENRLMGND